MYLGQKYSNDLNVQVAYLIDDHKANETTATIFFGDGDLLNKVFYVFQREQKTKTALYHLGDISISVKIVKCHAFNHLLTTFVLTLIEYLQYV